MRSWQITHWDQPLERREAEPPTPTGTEVLIRVSACGVCHSDVHIREGYYDLGRGRKAMIEERGATLPLTMGHEIAGVVEAVGQSAQGVQVGDRRLVFPWIGCRDCERCAAGDDIGCARARFLGTRVDGGYAEHVLVPHPKYLIDLGDLSAEQACVYACARTDRVQRDQAAPADD